MEKDAESSTVILYTQDYDKFKTMEGNRDIVPRKIKKLKESIQEGLDLLRYCPIIVNEKLEVIDGQHRLEVSKELGRPVFYVIAKNNMHIKNVAEMNCNTDKWKNMDYVDCFIKQGNDNYDRLYKFMGKHGLTVSAACSFLMKGVPGDGGHVMIHVRNGTFKVKHEEEAEAFLKYIEPIRECVDSPKSRDYLNAMLILQDSVTFNLEDLIEKLKASGLRIQPQTNKKAYLSHIEDIVNFKKKVRVRIY